MKRSAIHVPAVALLAIVVGVALTATACNPRPEQVRRAAPSSPATATAAVESPTATATIDPRFKCEHALPGESLAPVRVYLMFGDRLASVQRAVNDSTSRSCSLEQLLRGPTEAQKAQGLMSAIPAGTRVLSAKMDRSTAIVDLSKEFATGGGSLSMLARVAQVVYTATQFSGVEKVLILVEGESVEALGGEGLILAEPQSRADYEDLAPSILVEEPSWGSPVVAGQTVTFSGTVYDASGGLFHLELTDGNGVVVVRQLVSTQSAMGTRRPFSVELTVPRDARVGWGAIVASRSSSKDGKRTITAEIPLEIRAATP